MQKQIAEYRAQEIDLVKSTVLDDARADRIIVLLGERDLVISDQVEKIITHREEMSILNADYDTERASFDKLMSNYIMQRKSGQQEIITLIAAMKKEMTVDEWRVISKFQLKRLNLRETGYRQASGGV